MHTLVRPLVFALAILVIHTSGAEESENLTEVMPFLLEDKLRACGATFAGAPKFQAKLVVSERLVSGQNPASASGVGAMGNLLKASKP